jgi:type II secretory pathway component GspD/PulD (secretin)
MKTVLFAALLAACSVVSAVELPPLPVPPAAQGFQTYGSGMPLSQFLKDVLGDIAHRPYILAPEVAASQIQISADLSRYRGDVIPLVRQLLDAQGLALREFQGVFFVEKKKETKLSSGSAKDIFVYTPHHRAVGSLIQYLTVFPEVHFTYSSGLAVKSAAPSPAAQAGLPLQQTMTSGATTYSQTDTNPSFLVAEGTPSEITRLKDFLTQIDIAVPEVLIRAYLFEIRNTSHSDSGVSVAASILNNRFGMSLGDAQSAATGFKMKIANVSLAVNALASDSRVRLVSSSYLRAPDGVTSNSTVAEDVPSLGSIVTSNGTSTQSIERQKAGKLLSVSPKIFADSIRVLVSLEQSSFATTNTSLNSPTKIERSFKSEAIAQDGETILLGGDDELSQTKAKSKTFFGFGSDTGDSSDSQLVLLLKIDRI